MRVIDGFDRQYRADPAVFFWDAGVGRGLGEFYGDDTYNGKDIRARFIWSDITADSARWEQAFSVDQEETWMTNWIMEMTRSPQ